MKILLVNPPNCGRSIPEEEYGIDTIKMIFRGEPLALEVIAGNLDGHAVAIADLKVAPNVLEKTLDQFEPDLVGFTGVTCEANTVVRLAGEVKRNSDALVVVGGHHASCDPAFFNHDAIDYIVMGLGKLSFRELVDAIANRTVGSGVAGVAKTNPGGSLDYVRRAYSHADLVDDRPPRYDLVAAAQRPVCDERCRRKGRFRRLGLWLYAPVQFLLHPEYDRWTLPHPPAGSGPARHAAAGGGPGRSPGGCQHVR